MKVISLWQPWASLFALDLKHNETRSWCTSFRGPLAIHASKIIVPFDQLFNDLTFAQRFFILEKICEAYGDYKKMPTGAIIATSNLHDITATEKIIESLDWLEKACGDYSPGRFAWMLKDIKRLEEPIMVKGHQRLWDFDINGKGGN
jgi:hypothetical protein